MCVCVYVCVFCVCVRERETETERQRDLRAYVCDECQCLSMSVYPSIILSVNHHARLTVCLSDYADGGLPGIASTVVCCAWCNVPIVIVTVVGAGLSVALVLYLYLPACALVT